MPEVENSTPTTIISMALWPSTSSLFGKYDVGRLLGCGAFAKVYYARDISTGQSVAIKIINKHKISHNANLVANVKREIDIMRRLRHPNIVKLYEVMATKTKIYFVMEFVKGGELFAKVAKGRLAEPLSRKYFQQLVSAVGYCHDRGVFHRDLKPENLLIDENGDLKVSDFGLSAVTGQIRADGLLHTLCGTPSYVAPEILTKRGYDGARADVWSCGIILFVMNAAYLPFNDPNLMMMYKKIYKGEYKCPKWMSPDLKRFLSRVLETRPELRITIDEIKSDPWFWKGFKEARLDDQVEMIVKPEDIINNNDKSKMASLNAFDIISFSSGLDLSPLFDGTRNAPGEGERLVIAETPENVIEKVTEIAAEAEVRLKKRKEYGVDLVAQSGKHAIGLEVFRLTENLVVVEVRSNGGGREFYDELWKRKIRSELVEQRRPVEEVEVVTGN